jgi:hypothetical protein
MVVRFDEENARSAAIGVRYRNGEPATSALQNEYLIAENRILRSHSPARVRLTDLQRATLAGIANDFSDVRRWSRCLCAETGDHPALD